MVFSWEKSDVRVRIVEEKERRVRVPVCSESGRAGAEGGGRQTVEIGLAPPLVGLTSGKTDPRRKSHHCSRSFADAEREVEFEGAFVSSLPFRQTGERRGVCLPQRYNRRGLLCRQL